MSRRFGRNQRRKLREAVASGRHEIARLESIASDHHKRMLAERSLRQGVERHLVDWASRILTVAGPNSAFALEMASEGIDEGLFEAVAIRGSPYRLGPMEPIDSLGPTRAGEIIDGSRTIVEAFAVRTLTDSPEFHRVRFQIVGPDGGRALMLDKITLARLRVAGDPGLVGYLLGHLVKPYLEDGKARREHDFSGPAGACVGCGRHVEECLEHRYCAGEAKAACASLSRSPVDAES